MTKNPSIGRKVAFTAYLGKANNPLFVAEVEKSTIRQGYRTSRGSSTRTPRTNYVILVEEEKILLNDPESCG